VPGKAAAVAFIATPWRALAGLGVQAPIPRSIVSVSITATPNEDGGAVLHIDAVDESPESAMRNAMALGPAINALTQQNVGALGALLFGGSTLSLVEKVDLHADGKIIRGDARVTARQLERLLGFAEAWVDALEGGPPPGLSPGPPPAVPQRTPPAPGPRPMPSAHTESPRPAASH
jgi:hypothetical protein